jgi:hypothetical protein
MVFDRWAEIRYAESVRTKCRRGRPMRSSGPEKSVRRMKNYSCSNCGNTVYFENVECVKCGSTLGFDTNALSIVAIESAGGRGDDAAPPIFRKINGRDDELLRYCANAEFGVCNWLTLETDSNTLCKACDLNRLIPNLSEAGSLHAWREMERAKKRLVYTLLRFGLPFDGSASTKGPLTFDFVRNALTGHLDGVVTIDVTEADAVERERQRQQFDEPYRSLLGHLRHESGHYYWMVLVEEADRLEEFRVLFGDERDDYGAALARHHRSGPLPDWQDSHVSAYASAHPWEDWAETWAHYLHMVDALDTAEAEGMEGRAGGPIDHRDVYRSVTFHELMARWVPLTIAMNSLSRSMGHDDFYPFVIPEPAYDKLAFVHRVIHEHGTPR